ncbi:GyrI-like domain-containing protein [Pseudomonas poae]|uniref:GyrI-like domain-containing protein n=1 Tax=Pseudomonas poae TaxID=200451 RepID=UPI0034D3E673
MDQQTRQPLEPRMEAGRAMVIAGVKGRYSKATVGDIPRLWELFDTCIKDIKQRVGGVTYGVCHNPKQDEFDYLAGVEVPSRSDVPGNFESIDIAPLNYAVFTHHGPVQAMEQTFERIMFEWLPRSGYKVVGANFERYSADFDGRKGTGTVEIWLPVGQKA